MVKSSVRFERGDGYWVAERDSIGFTGTTDFGPVEFLITSEALAEMPNPALEGIDPETAVEVFIEFETTFTASPSVNSLNALVVSHRSC